MNVQAGSWNDLVNFDSMVIFKSWTKCGGENGETDIVHNTRTGDDCFLEDMTEKFRHTQANVNVNLKASRTYPPRSQD